MIDTESRVAKKDSVRITATISTGQHEALLELAGRKKVSIAWLIREAVDKLVEEMDGGRRLPFDS